MKRKKIIRGVALFSVLLSMVVGGCSKKDDTTPDPVVVEPLKAVYNLQTKDILGVTGTVTIAEKVSGSSESIVTIKVNGAPAGTHPAHIHMNSAVETGPIAYPLSDVDINGNSSTTLSVSYNTLINYDGYVNVHLDALTLGTIIAQADIGGNWLTGTNHTYSLIQDSTSGVTGSAKFEKRKNGNTLVSISLIAAGGTLPAGQYPAQINLGSVATVGTPVKTKTLNPVDGASRLSKTNVRTLDDNSPITYNNWLVYDGFITIYDAADTTNIIAKGNIGSN